MNCPDSDGDWCDACMAAEVARVSLPSAVARIADLQAALSAALAREAAMREALGRAIRSYFTADKEDPDTLIGNISTEGYRKLKAALSSDAGKAMLERVARLEEALLSFRAPDEGDGFFHDCVAGDCSKCQAARAALKGET